ncbi:pro-neuregulin-2, membrane-bound isoform-like [Argiope bruennichi]|uniref:pro-neuregulin-2, membrane-bound isoform-like n=1 Tax=Argiope bruennichi TaxID=94029 RepID=UPI002494AB5F|nr:pro-neuregulin-2, membrane-bound isoform-like [Argiope bruennichi]
MHCSCSPFPWWSLLLLATAAATCPLLGDGVTDAPTKAYLAPIVFHGRLVALARRGPAQQATFLVDKVFKSPQALAKSVVVEFAYRKNSSKCRGAPYTEGELQLANRYVVFAARRRQYRSKMIAVTQPEPYSKRKAVSRVLCANCAKAPSIRGLNDVKVDIFSKLKLKCRISGNPPPKVVWFKNGLKLKADGRIKLRSKRRYSHLIINRVSLDDAGHYKCIAKNILGNATAFANVIAATTTTESPFWQLRKDPCPRRNFCLNGGVCIYFAVVKEYACECADGYGGQRCETKVISTLSIDFQGE